MTNDVLSWDSHAPVTTRTGWDPAPMTFGSSVASIWTPSGVTLTLVASTPPTITRVPVTKPTPEMRRCARTPCAITPLVCVDSEVVIDNNEGPTTSAEVCGGVVTLRPVSEVASQPGALPTTI